MRFLYKKRFLYATVVVLAILSGVSQFKIVHDVAWFISESFIRAFKCISLPLIALSLITVLSNFPSSMEMKKIAKQTFLYTLSTTLVAAFVACILYLVIHPQNINATISQPTNLSSRTYADQLLNLIPSNIFSPFLEHQVIGVLLVGVLVGFAIRWISNEAAQKTIVYFFQGFHSLFIVITKWIVSIIPLALYGFITTTIVQLKQGMHFGGLVKYLCVVIASNLVQGCIVLPIWLYWNRISPLKVMHGMLPALSLAFFSKSSSGTLPITMETAEKNLNISPKISRFVLPLCTTINMNGCAAFIFATVMYLMQNHGFEVSWTSCITWIFIATIAAIGNAGVPMGCFFLSASLLSSMDIPITLLGIILPFYGIIDMVETTLNVWSDSCVAKVIDSKKDLCTA